MSKKQTPFDKIVETKNTLEMFVKYGDAALKGQSYQAFSEDVLDCYRQLMTFRNMVRSMSSFEETPEQAAKQYIDDFS